MKYILISLCLCAGLSGQAISPATPQAAPKAAVAPDSVVLKVGTRPMTAAEFQKLIAAFPAEIQQAAKTNPKQVVQSYFLMQSLMQEAEKEKLDQVSPVKEQLELQRMQLLAQTLVNKQTAAMTVSPEEEMKRYEADKTAKYAQVKLRGILIHFADAKAVNAYVDMSDPKNPKSTIPTGLRTEAEAKTIAEELAGQLKAGMDFAEIAKQKSEDKVSAVKGGDLGTVRQLQNMPAELKKAAFSLQAGQVSDPVRAPNGYYILKVDERTTQPFSEVQAYVANDVKQERLQKWIAETQKPFEVTVENPAFFSTAAPAKPTAQ